MNETPARRKQWKVVRCNDFDAMRAHSIREWQRQSAAARRKAAWDIVVEAWAIQKRDPNELRLQRPLEVVRKA